jgi:hypothetical protein
MFNEALLKSVLSDKHKAEKLYLTEDEDFLYLMKQGDPLPQRIFSSKGATFAEIRKEADQILEWDSARRAGIVFERVRD